MNCWELLGIEPTRDHQRIHDAYESQLRDASDEQAIQLKEALKEAVGAPENAEKHELNASDGQVVREVIIQIKALLNDSGRTRDAGIWKAILCEPPADQLPLRREIGLQLEPQLRPMAENGSFPAPVVGFLAEWFDWHSLQDVLAQEGDRSHPERNSSKGIAVQHADQRKEEGAEVNENESADSEPRQIVNFWPAVIGWIIGLVILAILFGGMSGN